MYCWNRAVEAIVPVHPGFLHTTRDHSLRRDVSQFASRRFSRRITSVFGDVFVSPSVVLWRVTHCMSRAAEATIPVALQQTTRKQFAWKRFLKNSRVLECLVSSRGCRARSANPIVYNSNQICSVHPIIFYHRSQI